MKIIRPVLMLMAASALLAACGGSPNTGRDGPPGDTIVVEVTPGSVTLEPGATRTFTASVTGTDDPRVTWSATAGSIDGEGATVSFTAPQSEGNVLLRATSVADPEATGEASITVSAAGAGDGEGSDAPALHDTIAYVRGDTRDEIRAVRPDGSDDRLLWAHGRPDDAGALAIFDLAWSPDARELAFAGTHEFDCSLLHSDIYAVGTDGSDYRRLTTLPACEQLSDFPTGTVRVPVRNDSFMGDSVDIFMYFLGAPEAKQISLPPGGTTTVTFENVADFGEGVVQYAMLIHAGHRELAVDAAADVIAGGTVTTATQSVFTPGSPGWEARSPSWRSDGSRVGYAYGFNGILALPPRPEPLTPGSPLVEAEGMPNTVFHLAWNPAAQWADELLYVGWTFDARHIHLVNEGSSTPGEILLTFESYETVFDLAWLPDGSGFVFSLKEGAFGDHSDLYAYSLVDGSVVRLTSFEGEYAGKLAVSPDGREIVFERATAIMTSTEELVEPDLWILDLDGNLRLLVENGADPAWSAE